MKHQDTPELWDTDSFAGDSKINAPLAERMRPNSLTEFAGQEHLIGDDRILRRMIETDRLSSMIF